MIEENTITGKNFISSSIKNSCQCACNCYRIGLTGLKEYFHFEDFQLHLQTFLKNLLDKI